MRWRTQLPVLVVVVVCVAAVVAAVTGSASPVNAVQFLPPGHWVFNAALQTAFHVDGATAGVDGEVPGLPDYPEAYVVEGDSSGYVVGSDGITEFGESDLEVVETVEPPAPELPDVLQATGGPYLVYQDAGVVVRFGGKPVRLAAGGPLGKSVVTSDGTLWLERTDRKLLCLLASGASRISCPVGLPEDSGGALTVVDDRPAFVDTATDQLYPVAADGLGTARDLGVSVGETAQVAGRDVSGRVAILDPAMPEMHLVDAAGLDPAREAREPKTVKLPAGDYVGPVASESVVAVMDRSTGTLSTFDAEGQRRDIEKLPREKGTAGEPRITSGEDDRLYVDEPSGEHVLVVDRDGSVTDVDIGQEPGEDKPPNEYTDGKSDKETDSPEDGPPEEDEPEQPGREVSPEETEPDDRIEQQPDQRQPDQPPPTPATAPGAPGNVRATPNSGAARVSWQPAPDNRSPILYYTVSWTNTGGFQDTLRVNGNRHNTRIRGLANGVRYVFTVTATNAVGSGPGVSSNAVTPMPAGIPAGEPTVRLRRGADTESDRCLAPNCSWLDVTLRNFEPNTTYTVTGVASEWGDNFSEPAIMTTDANGYSRLSDIRFDGPGQTVWVRVEDAPDGPLESNRIFWEPRGEQSNAQVTLSQGPPTEEYCGESPDCAWMHVVFTGFPANTPLHVAMHSSNPDLSDPGYTVTTDENGEADRNKFAYSGVGDTVYVTAELPNGREIHSNRITWESVDDGGPTVRLTQGEPTDEHCGEHPDCSWMHIELSGFPPSVYVELDPHSSNSSYDNPGHGVTTGDDGTEVADEFAYTGVGDTIYVTATLEDGTVIHSNEIVWEEVS